LKRRRSLLLLLLLLRKRLEERLLRKRQWQLQLSRQGKQLKQLELLRSLLIKFV